MTQEQRKVLEVYRQMWLHTRAEEPIAVDAALSEIDALRKDRERMDKLQEMQADTIYFDDGRIVDIGGKYFGDLRKAIDGIEEQCRS